MTIFNSDELPEAKSILDVTVDAVNAAAEQRAREKYDNIMQQVEHSGKYQKSIYRK